MNARSNFRASLPMQASCQRPGTLRAIATSVPV